MIRRRIFSPALVKACSALTKVTDKSSINPVRAKALMVSMRGLVSNGCGTVDYLDSFQCDAIGEYSRIEEIQA